MAYIPVIKNARLDADAVTTDKVLDGTIGTNDLADDAVTAAKVADGAVGTAQIADDSITQAKLQNNSVGGAQIIDGAVSSTKIANDTIMDADINSAAGIALSKLATDPLARANHTGTQTASTISDFDTQVQTSRLDQMAAPTAAVDFNGQLVSDVATPVSATDAATKGYVDDVAQGLQVKDSVRAASTGNLTLSGTQTVDGVALIAGDRILVKDQTSAATNGIYVVAAGAWSRAADLDEPSELTAGIFTFVEEGTTNADTGWVLSSDNPVVLGTDPQTWTQFSGAGSIQAGDGLTKTGNTLDVDNTVVRTSGAQSIAGVKTLTDTLNANGGVEVAGAAGYIYVHGGGDVYVQKDADGTAYGAQVLGDTNDRLRISTSGEMTWGDGSSAPDTTLTRSAAGQLSLWGAIGLYVDAELRVGGKTHLAAGIRTNLTTVAGDHTVDVAVTDALLINSAAAIRTVTLPAIHSQGDQVKVKRSGANNVVVATADTDTIDGSASDFVIDVDLMAVTFVSDGTGWWVF